VLSLFRFTNRITNKFGILISKPELLHGSPAFSGAITHSRKLFIFKQFYDLIADIEGDVIEAGIHWGYGLLGHLLFISAPYRTRTVYAFDSFAGHSNPTKEDISNKKYINLGNTFKVSEEDVNTTLINGTEYTKEELNKKIKIIKGWAHETMNYFTDSNKIAFVHCDMDIYESVKITLESFWPKLNIGGIICIGKLYNEELMGKTFAFTEFVNTLEKGTYEVSEIKIKELGTLKMMDNTIIKKIN